jgi:hypothetical protein
LLAVVVGVVQRPIRIQWAAAAQVAYLLVRLRLTQRSHTRLPLVRVALLAAQVQILFLIPQHLLVAVVVVRQQVQMLVLMVVQEVVVRVKYLRQYQVEQAQVGKETTAALVTIIPIQPQVVAVAQVP